jgi:tripartite-type tricarboxylate transporter receptor subunit TctC
MMSRSDGSFFHERPLMGGAMKIRRRQFLQLAAGSASLSAVSRIALAQAYPTRPITIIVANPAGGPSDVIARILAERMRRSLGQTIISKT